MRASTSPGRPRPRPRRAVSPVWAWAIAALTPACSAPEKRVPLDVPGARAPTTTARVGEEVARLLGSDRAASEAAARELEHLDDDGREALAAHAKTIPLETDPRWLSVLDFHGLLPDAGPAARARLLGWQASRRDKSLVWRAQSGLLDLARTQPDALIGVLGDAAYPARDAVAIALADAGEKRSVPALVELYRAPRTPVERRAASLALGRLAGEERRPRVDATDAERARDVERLLAWYRESGGRDAAH